MRRILFPSNVMQKGLQITVLGFFVLLSSCKHYFYSGSQANVDVSLKYEVPVELNIDTTRTLQATSQTKVYLGFITIGDKHFHDAFSKGVGEKEKMAAMYKALKDTKYDIMVNPKYIIETKNVLGLFRSTTATVAGYGANVIIK